MFLFMYQNSTYESNPISHISCCHNANPLFLLRGSENLCEGRCFKRLIIQVTISHTTICSPLPLGMCHFVLEWANSATNSSSIFYHISPLPYPASWRKEEKKGMERKGHVRNYGKKVPQDVVFFLSFLPALSSSCSKMANQRRTNPPVIDVKQSPCRS